MTQNKNNPLKSIGILTLCLLGVQAHADTAVMKNVSQLLVKKSSQVPPPESWQESKAGQFAHSLKYEDKLAKPVAYEFPKSHLGKAQYTVERKKYFEHLCSTEAGNYIWDTASGVSSVVRLRSTELPYKAVKTFADLANKDKATFSVHDYMTSATALESPLHFDALVAIDLVDQAAVAPKEFGLYEANQETLWRVPSSWGFAYDSWQEWYNNAVVVEYALAGYDPGRNNYPIRQARQIPEITARYGVTWKGFERARDREFGIAGGDLIIVDRKDNRVMAVQRDFTMAGINFNGRHLDYYWLASRGCEQLRPAQLLSAKMVQGNFIKNVLKPSNPLYKDEFLPIENKAEKKVVD